MDDSNKIKKLQFEKWVNRQISKYMYTITALKQENLKSREKIKLSTKKLEQSKSHVTANPRISTRSNDSENSKTKHQLLTAGSQNEPTKIKTQLLQCYVLTTELGAAVHTKIKVACSKKQF